MTVECKDNVIVGYDAEGNETFKIDNDNNTWFKGYIVGVDLANEKETN